MRTTTASTAVRDKDFSVRSQGDYKYRPSSEIRTTAALEEIANQLRVGGWLHRVSGVGGEKVSNGEKTGRRGSA